MKEVDISVVSDDLFTPKKSESGIKMLLHRKNISQTSCCSYTSKCKVIHLEIY